MQRFNDTVSQSDHNPPSAPCPDAVADVLRLGGLDPSVVGDDWLDILLMVGDIEVDCHQQ